MANKPKQVERDRRAKVEEMRKAEQARERRKSMLFVILAVVVGVAPDRGRRDPVVPQLPQRPGQQGAVVVRGLGRGRELHRRADQRTPATTCGKHVADGTVEKYDDRAAVVRPALAGAAFPAREFYTARDRPEMEQLVHNLEHGYTIVWYDDTIKGAQLEDLQDIATRARTEDAVGPTGKFIVSAWDDAYGDFPSGKHIGISHWGATDGHIQLCGKVSGAVVQDFIDEFPSSDSPEPNAA